ncbi:MAG: ankyrin repeat domain-containing protein, partial [Planctomycetes bacterium]|nr:ankyrin repeat domain-containing protein [Planctomycetota bacterium]
KPDDVRSLIEMRVHNDGGDEDDIDINTDDIYLAEFFTYPCAAALYTTGHNEDTRKNVSLFIFTDVYSFEVAISATADWFKEYNDRLAEWVMALEFVEDGNAVNRGSGDVISDEDFLELCKYGTPRNIERAIKTGANLEARNEYGETPLLVAIEYNENSRAAAVLMKSGADLDAKDGNGETALITAAKNRKDTDVLLMLLEAGADVNETNEDGDTALHYAAYWNNNPEVVKTLIEHGADVDGKGEYERTPLMRAVAGSEAGNIIALLDAGADADLEDEDGKKAIDHTPSEMPSWADEDTWKAAMARLSGGGKSAGNAMSDKDFLELCVNGTPEEVERAIKSGANVNAVDDDGVTPLMYAARSNVVPVAALLLEAGADIEAYDRDGDMPLHWAALGDNPATILFLLDQGADAGATNNNGRKAIEWLSELRPDGVNEDEWEAAIERLKVEF